MKIKNIYIAVMIFVAGFLILEINRPKPNVWLEAVGVVVFFYGMMRLSAKTPSKNDENQNENEE